MFAHFGSTSGIGISCVGMYFVCASLSGTKLNSDGGGVERLLLGVMAGNSKISSVGGGVLAAALGGILGVLELLSLYVGIGPASFVVNTLLSADCNCQAIVPLGKGGGTSLSMGSLCAECADLERERFDSFRSPRLHAWSI